MATFVTMTRVTIGAIVTRISNIVHKYRWELTLFIGIHLAVDAISWGVWQYAVGKGWRYLSRSNGGDGYGSKTDRVSGHDP